LQPRGLASYVRPIHAHSTSFSDPLHSVRLARLDRSCRASAPHARSARHRHQRPRARLARRRRDAALRGQRYRCRRRHRLRARRRPSPSRKPRRRRLPSSPQRHRGNSLHRLPRKSARRGHRKHVSDAQGNVIPESSKDSSVVGYKSIGVPGSVAGLVYAEKQYGKLSIEKVMAPAIKFARDGFPLAYEDTQALKDDEYLAQFPESKRIFLRDGNYYRPGELFKQPELARTLERLAKDPDTFYHGAMARELAAAIHKGGGMVTAADLAAYEVKEREPIRGSYRGYDIISAPPPSSGGVALVEILNILEGYDLAKSG